MDSTPIDLVDVSTGNAVEALLHDDISPEHLEMYSQQWPGAFEQLRTWGIVEGDSHWKWGEKVPVSRKALAYNRFCVECNGSIEGLMITRFPVPCSVPSQKGKDLVYIELLATAPWNRSTIFNRVQYRRVGTYLFRAAVQFSKENELKGRVGLHSLRDAEKFYRKFDMLDLGVDPNKKLRYFELTEERVNELRK